MEEETDEIVSATDDEEEETLNSQEVFLKLQTVWINEKLAPELLAPPKQIINCVIEQIGSMEKNLEEISGTGRTSAKIPIHRLEVERVRFILASYLRTRLYKIHHHIWQVIGSDFYKDRLLPEELTFAQEYAASIENYVNDALLCSLPANFKALDDLKKSGKANVNCYVFASILERQQGLLVPEPSGQSDDIVDLETGSKHLLPYHCISQQLERGEVKLT